MATESTISNYKVESHVFEDGEIVLTVNLELKMLVPITDKSLSKEKRIDIIMEAKRKMLARIDYATIGLTLP